MKLSIITTSFNSAKTIEDTIKSVLAQNYPNIEHIFVDGGSTDGTLEIVKKYDGGYKSSGRTIKVISEKDAGMYDAMNKGIGLATGDIIGILNSDDFYASSGVIETVVNEFEKSAADCVWGDLLYVDRSDTDKVVRTWKSSPYVAGSGQSNFQKGWHPPHPTFFVKKWVYEKFGVFRTDLSTSADYELMLRLIEKNHVSSSYIPQVLVKMREGGASNKSYWRWIKANLGCYKAFKLNGLKISVSFIFRKPLSKIEQFIK